MADITIPIRTNLTTDPLDLGVFVSSVVSLALTVAAIATFIYLVWAGIQWITAGGEKGKIEEARNRITGALVGLAIVAVSWALFLLIDRFLGLGVAGGTSSSLNYQNNSSAGVSNFNSTNTPSGFVCVNPPIICADGTDDPYYCQNQNYHAENGGSCKNGNVTGTYCRCVPN